MKWSHFTTILALLTSCQSPEPVNGVQTVVYDMNQGTRSYQTVLKKYWRTETVFSNYETLYVLNVAAFLPEFQQAFKKVNDERFSGLDLLKNVKSRPSFFVSIYSPKDELTILTNDRIWEFVLKVGIREFPVKAVTKLKDKDAWSTFFPFVNRWSTDYLLSFDVPNIDQLTGESPISLMLSNAKAKTAIHWPR